MRDRPRFLLGDSARQPRDLSPTTTVLDYLRIEEKLSGTKEGCAEGDCGACTVVLGEPDGDRIRYRAVNACILFLPALDGKQLLTVEHLKDAEGGPHAVQRAMVDHHASQCGFCTPGFVMSLFALQHAAGAPSGGLTARATANEALAGNLCRCTGYRPIVDAAVAVMNSPAGAQDTAREAETAARLRALDTGEALELRHEGQTWFAPTSIAALTEILSSRPDAVLLAGGTDVGLWVTKQHRILSTIIALDAVTDLARLDETPDIIRIGATVLYEDALSLLEGYFPDFGIVLRRLGSRQIRNRGTIGGNIGNASPIGDTAPVLIALGATLVLRSAAGQRALPLERFFLEYRRTALTPGEFIERIDVPKPRPNTEFRCYKVAKRFDQDISAVCAAFHLEIRDAKVAGLRIGFGGMAATPVRAVAAEASLIGADWSEAGVRKAMDVVDQELTPISDMRASADYRRMVARNLLLKFYLETTSGVSRTRLMENA